MQAHISQHRNICCEYKGAQQQKATHGIAKERVVALVDIAASSEEDLHKMNEYEAMNLPEIFFALFLTWPSSAACNF